MSVYVVDTLVMVAERPEMVKWFEGTGVDALIEYGLNNQVQPTLTGLLLRLGSSLARDGLIPPALVVTVAQQAVLLVGEAERDPSLSFDATEAIVGLIRRPECMGIFSNPEAKRLFIEQLYCPYDAIAVNCAMTLTALVAGDRSLKEELTHAGVPNQVLHLFQTTTKPMNLIGLLPCVWILSSTPVGLQALLQSKNTKALELVCQFAEKFNTVDCFVAFNLLGNLVISGGQAAKVRLVDLDVFRLAIGVLFNSSDFAYRFAAGRCLFHLTKTSFPGLEWLVDFGGPTGRIND